MQSCAKVWRHRRAGINNMRRGTVLEKLFSEAIDATLRDRGLLHRVVPPAWLSLETWVKVLGRAADLAQDWTCIGSRLEKRRGGSVADCVDKDVRGLPLISVDMDGLQAIAKSSISHLTHQK